MSQNGEKQKDSSEEVNSEIVWDDYHCNPRAEVVLVSADMVGFRVDAFYNTKKSEFIKVLLTLPSAESISDAPIHLDQNADIVRHYVDYVTSSKAHDITLDMAGFQNLLDLCDHLQSPAIETFVLGAIKARMDRRDYPIDFDPWGIFALAARRDNVPLAKCSIGQFGHIDLRDLLVEKAPSFYENVPSRYFHALLRCALYPDTSYSTRKSSPSHCLRLVPVEQMVEGFSLD